MTTARTYVVLGLISAVALLSAGCGGGMSQKEMMKYARAGSSDKDDEDDDRPRTAPPRQVAQATPTSGSATKTSKPSKLQLSDDDDDAPPRKSQLSDDDDDAPPRKSQLSDDDDDAPPRKSQLSDDDDDAPPRKSQLSDDDDDAPGRAQSKTTIVNGNRKSAISDDADDDDDEPRTSVTARTVEKEEPPAKDKLESTMAELKTIYQSTWDKAKTAEDRREFAVDLQKKGGEMSDPVVKYALLITAMKIAMNANDPDLAVNCVADLEKSFKVDPYELKMEVVDKFRTIKQGEDSKNEKFLEEIAAELYDEAFHRDEFDRATMLFAIRQSAARRAADKEELRSLGIDKRHLDTAKTKYKRMKRSLDALAEIGDLEANTVAGSYYCFIKENWSRGLMLLAQGPANGELSKLARDEINGASTSNGWIAIGDQWWDYGADDEENQRNIRLHAVYIYKLAIPGAIDGVDKLRAEVRLKEARKILGDAAIDDLDPNYQGSYEIGVPRRR